jgi:CheY-like chemotaxis protein
MASAYPVLLVEDNPDDEALALRAFRKNHIAQEVVVARDGAEALDYLFGTGSHAGRDTRMRPPVVLLDLKLPRIDGLEVLRRLRADPRTQTQPVVVLTTSNEHSDLRTSYALHANSYIRKPVDFNEFTETLRSVAHYWLQLNEPPPDLPAN